MLYLPIGWLLGPHALNAIPIHIVTHAAVVEQITKSIILISLFSAGLKMRLPITSSLWFLSLRLAFLSMLITVGLIALAGIFLFGLPTGIAILMGGILAPTDPVLASGHRLIAKGADMRPTAIVNTDSPQMGYIEPRCQTDPLPSFARN